MLTAKVAPGLSFSRDNYFREHIKHVYIGTGTPFTVGYVDLFQQLKILGHKWTYDGFFKSYCVEDITVKRFNIFAQGIKEYKNVDQLLDLVEQYAFFARTENYYPFLPDRRMTALWVKQDEAYRKMSFDHLDNPDYRVFDGFICDTPAIFKLRLRQLASGFMGNAEESNYYSTLKTDKLQEILEDSEDNYVIFYNYTPELFMIMSAAEEAGYVYDVYTGAHKDLKYFNDTTITSKKLIIANIQSGSTGLNLQSYKNAVFYSLPDVWSDFEQGVGRIERIGQKSPFVDVYILMTIDTVETRIWDSLMKGKDYTDKMFERDYIYKEIE
jgi:SNF2 family DNA or RNA helicase